MSMTQRVNCPVASSAGRLFDAAAALLGLCEMNGFEGEAAMRLEQAATAYPGADPLAWRLERQGGLWVYDGLARLSAAGFEPYIGEQVPVNDGGIGYGQAAIAAARLASAQARRKEW